MIIKLLLILFILLGNLPAEQHFYMSKKSENAIKLAKIIIKAKIEMPIIFPFFIYFVNSYSFIKVFILENLLRSSH